MSYYGQILQKCNLVFLARVILLLSCYICVAVCMYDIVCMCVTWDMVCVCVWWSPTWRYIFQYTKLDVKGQVVCPLNWSFMLLVCNLTSIRQNVLSNQIINTSLVLHFIWTYINYILVPKNVLFLPAFVLVYFATSLQNIIATYLIFSKHFLLVMCFSAYIRTCPSLISHLSSSTYVYRTNICQFMGRQSSSVCCKNSSSCQLLLGLNGCLWWDHNHW